MRLTTVMIDGRPRLAAVRDDDAVIRIDTQATGLAGVRAVAAGGQAALDRLRAWLDRQPADLGLPLDAVTFGPAVPDPGAIYTIGHNYRRPEAPAGPPPDRPLVYGKSTSAVAGHGAILAWDRSLTGNVDPEVELGVVIGPEARAVAAADAMGHVFGYTIVNDVSSRDPWLDGDQWLLGKSMPGFCPLGPWVVTSDALDPGDLRLGCALGGVPIQEGSTAQLRTSIPDLIAFLSRHMTLRPGDVIATGTPARLAGALGPDRHLEAGDTVTAWIEHIGELSTTIA